MKVEECISRLSLKSIQRIGLFREWTKDSGKEAFVYINLAIRFEVCVQMDMDVLDEMETAFVSYLSSMVPLMDC
jgi:hypothetical protein